jgi:hypothetical protein
MSDNGNAHDNPRGILAEWLGRRVTITGMLKNMTTNKNPNRPFDVAVFDDVELELPTRARYNLGHLYVQNAEALRGRPYGRRVRCSCKVRSYVKRLESGESWTDYGLKFPADIQILPEPVFLPTAHEAPPPPPPAPPPPAPAPAPPPADPFAAVLRLRDGVQQHGGAAAVLGLLDAVAVVGGWDAAAEVMDLADGVGGADRLRQLLDVLKL